RNGAPRDRGGCDGARRGHGDNQGRSFRLCEEHRDTARRRLTAGTQAGKRGRVNGGPSPMVEARARRGEENGREGRRVLARRTPAFAGNRTIDFAGAALVRTRDALLARAFGSWAYG